MPQAVAREFVVRFGPSARGGWESASQALGRLRGRRGDAVATGQTGAVIVEVNGGLELRLPLSARPKDARVVLEAVCAIAIEHALLVNGAGAERATVERLYYRFVAETDEARRTGVAAKAGRKHAPTSGGPWVVGMLLLVLAAGAVAVGLVRWLGSGGR